MIHLRENSIYFLVLSITQAPDPFNDKSNGVSATDNNEFKSDRFVTTFDDSSTGGFGGGFDDSFNSGFAAGRDDPFASKQDPFGDKSGALPAVTPDVSTNHIAHPHPVRLF